MSGGGDISFRNYGFIYGLKGLTIDSKDGISYLNPNVQVGNLNGGRLGLISQKISAEFNLGPGSAKVQAKPANILLSTFKSTVSYLKAKIKSAAPNLPTIGYE